MLRSTERPCTARWRHVCQTTGHWLPLRRGGQCRASGEPGRNLVAQGPLKMIVALAWLCLGVAFAWPLAASPPERAALPPFSAAQGRCRNSGGQHCPIPAALCGPLRAAQGQSVLRQCKGRPRSPLPIGAMPGPGATVSRHAGPERDLPTDICRHQEFRPWQAGTRSGLVSLPDQPGPPIWPNRARSRHFAHFAPACAGDGLGRLSRLGPGRDWRGSAA